MIMTWTRLIRFLDDSGKETFGEPCIEKVEQLPELLERGELYALSYTDGSPAGNLLESRGQSPISATEKGEKVLVKELLDILRPSDVPIIKCIGLNYIKHSM